MLKVFLVEDEIIVREGIKKNIDWEKNGYTFVGEASDGELAYPMIMELKPDIIITDIKMPFMDGLELSKLVRREMPKVKIMILSGYDEFEYAKEAISIGITDYLVKPISGTRLIEAIDRVKKVIDEEKVQQEFYEQFKREHQENQILEKQRFFEDLVSKRLSVSEVLDKGRALDMELSAGAYNIMLLKLSIREEIQDTYCGELVLLEDQLSEYVAGISDLVLFNRGLEGIAILIKSKEISALKEEQNRYIEIIKAQINNRKEVDYFIGMGEPVNRLKELSKSYDTANKAFAYRFITNKNRVMSYEGIGDYSKVENEDVSLKSIDVAKVDRKILEKFLRSGSKNEVAYFIDDYLNSIGTSNIESLLFRQYVVMDINLTVLAFVEELQHSTEAFIEKCGDVGQLSSIIGSVEDTKSHLIKIIKFAIELRDFSTSQKYNSIIEQAKLFIHENYSSKNFSLNVVAASVNTSPSHFSTLFSQETGQTFVEYLTNVRMDKSKELLRCSTRKIADIGNEVGYNDPHYFSYLFKKINGCTMKDFRAGVKDE